MDKFVVQGGAKLNGTVVTSGSKNACLPLMFATLLADGEHVLKNAPVLADVEFTRELLTALNCQSQREGHVLRLSSKPCQKAYADYDIVRKMRASILCLGPLLSRYGYAEVSLPGGCAIGSRPIDLHLDGLRAMGAEIEIQKGYVIARCTGSQKKLKGTSILFENATVGGTENLMMAATLADGETLIENAAKEPEVVDLAKFLKKMGAQIEGEGSSVIRIKGVENLKAVEHEVIPDRIEAGTLLLAGAITGGEVCVTDCEPLHIEALIAKMREAGFQIDISRGEVSVRPESHYHAVDITTAPHPLFPTDLQAQFMSFMTGATGTSVISETIFENRFMHVQELVRLGADITPKTHVAVVRGPTTLEGAQVMATDLRASASLVLAGLMAEGETHIKRIYHLDRGYEQLEKKLNSLGAQITRTRE